MGFFAQLSAWLERVLTGYIAVNTARIAEAIEPLAVALALLYTIVWGYLQISGRIAEPLLDGIKRIIVMATILGVSIQLWMYNDVIVDTFFFLPSQLGARLVGQFDPANIIDGILFVGTDVARALIQRGSVFNDNLVFYLAGGTVYLTIIVTALYTTFLLTLSRIALSVLLALGPLFISLLFFETTKRFFESWVAQLANYALITVLTVLVAALMMSLALVTAQDALSVGGRIEISDALRLVIASGLTFLVMRQVMPMAAGLASGLALSTFGLASAALSWGFGGAKRHAGQIVRGLTDAQTTRWDPWSRKAGYYVRRGMISGATAALGRQNSVQRR